MSTGYQVRYDPGALAALNEAADYIEEQSGSERAAQWLRRMLAGVEKLENLPGVFSVESVRRGREIRSKLIMSHRIFYFIDEPSRTVYVIDIAHIAQDRKLRKYRG